MFKVSYLIGLYNKENFILDCVDSIILEATDDIEIEVCIVDDGSTDNSYNLIFEKYKNNSNIKIFKFEQNKGKNAAYNKAFTMATGDYICIFGADDIVVPGRTKKLLSSSVEHDAAVYGGLIAKDESLKEVYYKRYTTPQNIYSISMGNGLSGGCVIIPKKYCLDIFPIPENLRFEDWWVGYYLVKMDKVKTINEYVTYYRIGTNNDCGFYGGDVYNNVKKDYIRHLDYIQALRGILDTPYLDKSEDLRRAFLDKPTRKTIYIKPFDSRSMRIILFKIFGAKNIYNIFYFFKRIISKI
ncbi:TPA: glycosyltransferase family 2 protein [Acinetobacter baumannii]|nr:glycosyltransferase family 2 protein [Acinetobacter baumannii]